MMKRIRNVAIVLAAGTVSLQTFGGWGIKAITDKNKYTGSCTNGVWEFTFQKVTVGDVTGLRLSSCTAGSGALDLTGFAEQSGCGYEVTSIWRDLFKSSTALTSFVGPHVIDVQSAAFQQSSVTSIVVSNGFCSVAEKAFYQTRSLVSFEPTTLPALVRPQTSMFQQSAVRGDFVFPAAVAIGQNCFNGADGVTSVSAPVCLDVGDAAFKGATSLTNFYGPNVVRILPHTDNKVFNGGFMNAASLVSVVLSNGIMQLGTSCFNGAASLKSLYPTSMPALTNLGQSAFVSTAKLTADLEFPALQDLGANAFSGSGVRSVRAPLVRTLGRDVFYGCSNLQEVTVLGSTAAISQTAIYNVAEGCSLNWLGPDAPSQIGSRGLRRSDNPSTDKTKIFVRLKDKRALPGWLALCSHVPPSASDRQDPSYPGRCAKGLISSSGNFAWVCAPTEGLMLILR